MRAATTTTAAILLTLTAATATAEGKSANDPKETCAEFSKIAEQVMEHRQSGTSMRRMMEWATTGLQTAMVEDAYNQPAFSTERYQQRAITRFGNDTYSLCYDYVTGE